jgi:hypothetical protein
MRLDTWYLNLLAASSVAAMGPCGTSDPTDEQRLVARKLHTRELEARSSGFSLTNRTGIEVNVFAQFFHAISCLLTDLILSLVTSTLLLRTHPKKEAI